MANNTPSSTATSHILTLLGLVGIVAQRLGGTTLHSFLGIGINKTMADFAECLKLIMNNPATLARWLTTQMLIADEGMQSS
jgi:hypothetical protein